MIRVSTSKGLSFVALMAALGNVLSFISIQLSPIVPSIPLGPVSFSLALDLSHLATFMAALLGGPVVGGLTGLVGGFVSAFQFGFSQGNIITGIGLPLGKAVTGIVAGILFQRISVSRWKTLAITVISYIPEAVFTAVIFVYLYPIFYGLPTAVAVLIAIQIIVKAFAEMLLLGTILTYIIGSRGFQNYSHSLSL
jgi:LytS/YehU family sensor histidine kinase